MDFSIFNTCRVALLTPIAALTLAGCSSSEGFVDYADVPAPSAEKAVPEAADGPAIATGDLESGSSVTDVGENGENVERGADAEGSIDVTPDRTASSESVSTVSSTAEKSDSETATPDANSSDESPDSRATDADPSEGIADATAQQTGDAAAIGEVTEGEPREIKLLIPEKRFRPEGDSKALRLSYDDIDLLKVLNMEPVPADAVDHFPQWLKDLDGKRVRLRGFMYPTFVATGITRFGLARDNGICCFVKQPKIYDMFDVSMADGESTDYIENKPFDVEGIFRIVPDVEDGELYELYRIEDAIVLK